MLSSGTFTIEAGANCAAHLHAESAGFLTFPAAFPAQWPSVNILGGMSCSMAFIDGWLLGIAQMHYASITGKGNVAGPQYSGYGNGIIDSYSGGANYFPGNAAGGLQYGGQYLA